MKISPQFPDTEDTGGVPWVCVDRTGLARPQWALLMESKDHLVS